jgi:CBS-domain-containing membrane protein
LIETAEEKVLQKEKGAGKNIYTYLCKMKGGKCPAKPEISLSGVMLTAAGSFTGIGLVALLAALYQLPLLLPSLGATAALLYGACHVPMAQPRNVLGGHVISALAGVVVYTFFGNPWWAIALGVTAAIVAMMFTHTLHPPGGATAFVAVYSGQHFNFVLSPVALGAACLLVIALLLNNLHSHRKYPEYWY